MAFLITAKTSTGSKAYYAIGTAARDALVDQLYDQGALGIFMARLK